MNAMIRMVKVLVFATWVAGCSAAPQETPSKEAALEYARSTPFVLGENPYEYGDEDPLNVYRDVPGYAGLWLNAQETGSSRLVIMTSEAGLSQSWVNRFRHDACGSPTVCDAETNVVTVPYSLRDLRSVAGWLLRSPMVSEVVPGERVETSAWFTFMNIEATERSEPVVREMLELAGVPAASYQLKVARAYNP